MLGMQVRLCAVRAGEFAVGILDGDDGVLRTSSRSLSSRPSRSAGQDASATLRSNDVGRLLAVREDGVRLHHRTGAVGRGHAGLRHETTRGHGTQDRRAAAANRRRSNRLRVRDGRGSLRHHSGRCGISLVRVRVLCH